MKLIAFVAWTSLSTSAVLPNVAFRVIEMHASPAVTALYFLLSSAGALGALLLVERWSGRIPPTTAALVGLVWTGAGFVVLTLASVPVWFVAIGAVLSLGVALPLSQYFAILGRLVADGRLAAGSVSRDRAVYAAVYIVGAGVGGVLGALVGARPVFLAVGIGTLIAAAAWSRGRAAIVVPAADSVIGAGARPRRGRTWTALDLFLGGLALASAGGQFRASIMPAFYLADAQVPTALIGWILGAAPVAEVPLLWLLPAVVRRFDPRRVMVAGTLCGVLFFAVVVATRACPAEALGLAAGIGP